MEFWWPAIGACLAAWAYRRNPSIGAFLSSVFCFALLWLINRDLSTGGIASDLHVAVVAAETTAGALLFLLVRPTPPLRLLVASNIDVVMSTLGVNAVSKTYGDADVT